MSLWSMSGAARRRIYHARHARLRRLTRLSLTSGRERLLDAASSPMRHGNPRYDLNGEEAQQRRAQCSAAGRFESEYTRLSHESLIALAHAHPPPSHADLTVRWWPLKPAARPRHMNMINHPTQLLSSRDHGLEAASLSSAPTTEPMARMAYSCSFSSSFSF